MFIKNVYKTAFNDVDYRILIRKPLSKAIIYTLILILFSGTFSIFLGYSIQKNNVLSVAQNIFDSMPEFSLSNDGFSIDLDKPIQFRLASKNFYVDSNRNLSEIIFTEEVSEDIEVFFVASDGYGTVKGSTLKSATYFEEVDYLNDITLTKDDFDSIYETLKLLMLDIFIMCSVICVIFFAVSVFIKAGVYSLVAKLIAKLKGEKAKFKDLYKISLYGQTLYILCYGIVLCSHTNLNFVVKMVLLEILSLVYVLYIILTYKRKRGVYNANSKKRA